MTSSKAASASIVYPDVNIMLPDSPWHSSKYQNLYTFIKLKADCLKGCVCTNNDSVPFLVFTTDGKYEFACFDVKTCLEPAADGATIIAPNGISFNLKDNPHIQANNICEQVADNLPTPPPKALIPTVPIAPIIKVDPESPDKKIIQIPDEPIDSDIQDADTAVNKVLNNTKAIEFISQYTFKNQVFKSRERIKADKDIAQIKQFVKDLNTLIYSDSGGRGVIALDVRSSDYMYMIWVMLYVASSITFDILSYHNYVSAGSKPIQERPSVEGILDGIDLLVSLKLLTREDNILSTYLSMLRNEYQAFEPIEAKSVLRRGNAGATESRRKAQPQVGGNISRKYDAAKFYVRKQYSTHQDVKNRKKVRTPALQRLLDKGKAFYRNSLFHLRTLNRTFAVARTTRTPAKQVNKLGLHYLRSDVHLIHGILRWTIDDVKAVDPWMEALGLYQTAFNILKDMSIGKNIVVKTKDLGLFLYSATTLSIIARESRHVVDKQGVVTVDADATSNREHLLLTYFLLAPYAGSKFILSEQVFDNAGPRYKIGRQANNNGNTIEPMPETDVIKEVIDILKRRRIRTYGHVLDKVRVYDIYKRYVIEKKSADISPAFLAQSPATSVVIPTNANRVAETGNADRSQLPYPPQGGMKKKPTSKTRTTLSRHSTRHSIRHSTRHSTRHNTSKKR